MRSLLLLLLCAAVLGCVPYSDNPLTDPGQQPMDTAIYGTWYWTDDNESGYIHFGEDAKTKQLTVAMVEFHKDGELRVSQLSGHTSSIMNNRYLNLKWVNQPDENPGYLFVKYAMEADGLKICLMDSAIMGNAIKNGLIKGEMTGDNWFTSIHITEDQEKLQKFVIEKDEELFDHQSVLHKLILPVRESSSTR